MDSARGHKRKFQVAMCEFLGQVFFMYAVNVSGATGSDSWGITGPLALFAVVNIFGGISGGHFNPAVTLGVYFREKDYAGNFIFMIMYIAAQLAGAMVGMLLSIFAIRATKEGEYIIPQDMVPLLLPTPVATELKEAQPGDDITLSNNWTTFYMEVICTFVFVLFILHVTGKHTVGPDLGVYGVPAICLVLWALCSVCNFTGASFNPALAFAQTVYQAWFWPSDNNPQNVLTHYAAMYIGGAAVGGILAGVFYNFHELLFHDPDADEEDQDGTLTSVNPEKQVK